MTVRNRFLPSSQFSFQNNVFYQQDLPRDREFETFYLSLREKENRVYSDEIVKILPEIPRQHPLRKEWMLRKVTLERLIEYLRKKNTSKILELGCGNGWLCNHLASLAGSQVVGMDINEKELQQASRVFNDRKNLCFVYADIFTSVLQHTQFDHIILASSIQYFPNLELLLKKLLKLLAPFGEILILDSPFYATPTKADTARKRSSDYFQTIGFPEMKDQYFHHHMQELKGFNFRFLYNPSSISTFTQRVFFRKKMPVFPIIQIKHT